jgi:hypothetical protein
MSTPNEPNEADVEVETADAGEVYEGAQPADESGPVDPDVVDDDGE